jgi:3-methyladenine DNA glycosylase/8-oxoguanine DNA glycosylase
MSDLDVFDESFNDDYWIYARQQDAELELERLQYEEEQRAEYEAEERARFLADLQAAEQFVEEAAREDAWDRWNA